MRQQSFPEGFEHWTTLWPHYIFSRKTYVKESYNDFYLEETYRLEHFCYARITEVTDDFLR